MGDYLSFVKSPPLTPEDWVGAAQLHITLRYSLNSTRSRPDANASFGYYRSIIGES